MKKQKR